MRAARTRRRDAGAPRFRTAGFLFSFPPIIASIRDMGSLNRWRACWLGAASLVAVLATLILQARAAEPGREPQTFLVVVDTSRAMQPRSEGTFAAIQALLDSSFNGELRPGDSLGAWSLSDKVNDARFAFQEWNPQTQLGLLVGLLGFVEGQAYEKQSRLDRLVPEIRAISKPTGLLTVLLVSSGEVEMRGTPFDAAINQAFKKSQLEQRAAKMPFLIALRLQQGEIIAWSVTPAPKRADFPAISSPPAVTATPEQSATPRQAK